MKTITKKHILIVEMEVLQSETNPEHLQTRLNVLKEMSYSQYEALIATLNYVNTVRNLIEKELKAKAEREKDGSTH